MKKVLLKCVVVAVLMLLSAGSAFAVTNTGFYVGISGGYVMPQAMDISNPDDSAQHFDAYLDNGYLLSIKTGWNTPFTRKVMAMEIEYNYINNNFDNDKIVPSPDHDGYPVKLDANMSIHTVLFNLKARYPEGIIHPYAGFGLGYAFASIGDVIERAYDGSGVEIWRGESGGGFCWQFLAGVDFDIMPNMSLGIGYKYFAAYPTIGDRYSDGIYADLDYRASIITAGLTFTF